MKLWAATRDLNKILSETVMEFPPAHSEEEWTAIVGELCRELDLSRPILMKKHLNELNTFRHTTFLPMDFMDGVDFAKFTVQIFPEKKKQR